MAQTEHSIQNDVLRHLSGMDLRVWRQNVGVAVPLTPTVRAALRNIEHRIVRFGIPGAADLTGILPDGRRLEVEIKTAIGRQSQQQERFEAMITRFGGLYIVARGVDDLRGIS